MPPAIFVRPFGWKPLILLCNSNKLDYRFQRCIFLNYSSSHHGYLCFNPLTNKKVISRHVVFSVEELHLGFTHSASTGTPPFLLPIPNLTIPSSPSPSLWPSNPLPSCASPDLSSSPTSIPILPPPPSNSSSRFSIAYQLRHPKLAPSIPPIPQHPSSKSVLPILLLGTPSPINVAPLNSPPPSLQPVLHSLHPSPQLLFLLLILLRHHISPQLLPLLSARLLSNLLPSHPPMPPYRLPSLLTNSNQVFALQPSHRSLLLPHNPCQHHLPSNLLRLHLLILALPRQFLPPFILPHQLSSLPPLYLLLNPLHISKPPNHFLGAKPRMSNLQPYNNNEPGP